MVNEEKVILMTKMASYEKHDGKKNINIVNYFRSDYIGFQVLKAIIAATIGFLACAAIYVFYNFEELMADIYKIDLMEMGKSVIIIYLSVVGVYAAVCYALFAHRYSKAKKELKGFYANLRKLESMSPKRGEQ